MESTTSNSYTKPIYHADSLYITRHGMRQDWADPNWVRSVPEDRVDDPPLSEDGMKQAKELGQSLKDTNIRVIFASPLIRTLQTATAVADVLNIPICLEYGVFEWPGNNKIISPLPIEELKKMFPRIDTSYHPVSPKITVPESKKFMFERCKQSIQKLVERNLPNKHKEKNHEKGKGSILVVTHAAPKVALVRGFLGNEEVQVRTGTCSVSKFSLNEEKGVWEHILNGDCSHLSKGEQYHWEFPEDKKRRLKSEDS